MEKAEKIDIRDLSIVDWVYHDDIVFGREIAKVHRLNKDKHGETIGITVYRSDGEFGVVGYICTSPTNNDIHPIPITVEVLEKSGFAHDKWSKKVWRYEDEESEVVYYIENGVLEITADDCKINLVCKCVAELQHALRLAKVGKEIVV